MTTNSTVQQRKFVIKAGMTVDDVKNSKDATSLQKKYASAFDVDGKKGFSQKEADLFNATTFAEKADGTVIFWTRQTDGTKKGTKFNIKDSETIRFSTNEEVKPYIKKVAVKKTVKQESDTKNDTSVSFFDDNWSGEQVRKLGFSDLADWLEDKDKICTDKKDDGKLSLEDIASSLAKGIVGGIPKAMVNHPVATVVAVCVGAAAVAATGGAILPVLGAAGVVTGAGMSGYGLYKAVTAETDGEAKQALETLGTGMTTTVLSGISAGKVLDKAFEAGVESAQVTRDANMWTKTVQMFKTVPEALKVSYDNAKLNVGSLFVAENSAQAMTYQKLKIQNQIRRTVLKNANKGHVNNSYRDLNTIKNVLNTVTEDNVDYASKLLDPRIGYDNYSVYTTFSEDNNHYLLKTLPRLLQSKDANVHRAVEYIIENPEISDKLFALDILNEKNAVEIMSLTGTPFKEIQGTVVEGTLIKNPTIQHKIWNLYRKHNDNEPLLPFTEDSFKEGSFKIQVYAEKGKVPNIPGIKPEVVVDKDTKNIIDIKYLLYENTSDKPNDVHQAQQAARSLIEQFGYKSGYVSPEFETNAQKFNWLMTHGCRTMEEKQWLGDYIHSDEYKLVSD